MRLLVYCGIHNDWVDGSRYTDIKCASESGKVYFLVTLVGEKVVRMAVNHSFVAVYTDVGCLHLYNLFGMSLSEPAYMPDLCFLECNDSSSLLAIQLNGDLFLWNIARQQLLLKVNVIPLVSRAKLGLFKYDYVTRCFVDNENNVLLNCSSGKVYRYDCSMGVFRKVKDLMSLATGHSCIDYEHLRAHSSLAQLLFSAPGQNGNASKADAKMEEDRTKLDQRRVYQQESNCLEERLSTAKALRLTQEYWILFRKYVLLLVETKNYEKIKALCADLLAIRERRAGTCSMLNLTEEEKHDCAFMGKRADDILSAEVGKLLESTEDPHILDIIASIKR